MRRLAPRLDDVVLAAERLQAPAPYGQSSAYDHDEMDCRVEGCPNVARYKAAQVCGVHYSRFRRTGTFDGRPVTNLCLQCGAALIRDGKRGGRLYCSPRCEARYRRRVSDEPMTCLLCGAQRIARGDAIWCSRKCASRAGNLRFHYGLDVDEYRAILTAQGYACAICKRSFAEVVPHVDHDHASGRVRGVLCAPCNFALGSFQDDPKRLASALAYLAAQE